MRKLDVTALVLIWIGALNWGTIGLFNFDLIHFIFEGNFLDRLAYVAIAAAALYQIINWRAIKQRMHERVSSN